MGHVKNLIKIKPPCGVITIIKEQYQKVKRIKQKSIRKANQRTAGVGRANVHPNKQRMNQTPNHQAHEHYVESHLKLTSDQRGRLPS